ncbi:MAG: response regulator [Bacilli bacterium]|nr:response regulator [Bacilli bacterium]MDD4808528.1 response regulator [Bacilli bacterium]
MRDISVLEKNGVNVQKSLELFVEMGIYEETLRDFLTFVGEKVSGLKEKMEEGDMPGYAILAHSLKSDARYLGFTELGELSYQHEIEGKANNVNYVYEHYNELMTELSRIIKVVSEYFGEEVAIDAIHETPVIAKEQAILVVDDSDIIRNYIYKIFNQTYEVIMAHDGETALNYIASDTNHKIVAMLLDLNMPNINGFEVLDFFQQNNLFTQIPVSIITGDDSKETINRAFDYSIVDVLSKPFNERDVKLVVDKTIAFK